MKDIKKRFESLQKKMLAKQPVYLSDPDDDSAFRWDPVTGKWYTKRKGEKEHEIASESIRVMEAKMQIEEIGPDEYNDH